MIFQLQRQSLELLLYVASNIKEISAENKEVLSNIVKFKALKSKQVLNSFGAALKQAFLRGFYNFLD